jgi:hypothetical protein
MRISGKALLTIDRLFWLPHRLAEFLLRSSRTDSKTGNQILVIKFMGLGSIIRLASLCEKNHVDKSSITLLTLSSNNDLCQRIGFRNTLLISTKNIFLFSKDCVKILASIRSSKPGLIIDFERCSHSVGFYRTILTTLAGGSSVSFESKRAVTFGKQVIYSVRKLNQKELFMKGIELMPTVSNEFFEKTIDIHSTKILININASNYLLARRYPVDSFADIIKSLHAWDPRLEFYLTGTSEETEYANRLIEKLPGLPIHNVSGKWSIEKLWNELSDCALFITGDSGPLHLAAYIGITTIAIWGPTQPEHFGYTDEGHLHHISLRLSCSPCFKHPSSHPARACKDNIDCLKNMRASLITKKAIHILSSHTISRSIHIPITIVSNASSHLQPTMI